LETACAHLAALTQSLVLSQSRCQLLLEIGHQSRQRGSSRRARSRKGVKINGRKVHTRIFGNISQKIPYLADCTPVTATTAGTRGPESASGPEAGFMAATMNGKAAVVLRMR